MALNCCVILLANLSPFSWLVAVLAAICFFLDFSTPAIIALAGLMLVAAGSYFFSAWLAASSQIFYKVRTTLNLLFMVIALSSAFSSDFFMQQLYLLGETQQALGAWLLLKMTAGLLQAVSYSFLVLIAVTLVLEISVRLLLGRSMLISESVFTTLRSFALVSLLVIAGAEITSFVFSSFAGGFSGF